MIDQQTESLVVGAEARASALSRRFVTRTLERWRLEALVDTAVLLTSELVTNAVVHAQTDVLVSITRTDERTVSVSVRDDSPVPPRLQHHRDDSTTGRGLGIIDALAASWKVVSHDVGKTVRFTLSLPAVPETRVPDGV